MFTTLFFLSLLVTLFRSVYAQELTLQTPQLTQCQPAQIPWSGGQPPYDLLVVSADDMCGPALEDLGNTTSQSVIWTVNIPAGTQVVLSLEDDDGNEAWSGTITIANSNDTSCLPSSPSSSALPSSSGAVSTTVSPSGPGAATTPSASSPSSSAFAPAGAANAGLLPNSSGSMRPLNAATLIGCAALALFAFAL